MSVPRLFQQMPLHTGAEVLLETDASHYVLHVLRFKPNDELHLFNGDGGEYRATLLEGSKRQARFAVHEHLNIECESPLTLHLGQALARGDRMDYAIQKAVELGVTEITPLITAHCAVKLNPQHLASKQEHWKKVIISACEQCGRNRLPTLNPILSLEAWAAQCPPATDSFVLSPTATLHLKQFTTPHAALRLVIGPEGGLSEEDLEICRSRDFKEINLGPRILRTETAAAAAIAVLQAMWGDG